MIISSYFSLNIVFENFLTSITSRGILNQMKHPIQVQRKQIVICWYLLYYVRVKTESSIVSLKFRPICLLQAFEVFHSISKIRFILLWPKPLWQIDNTFFSCQNGSQTWQEHKCNIHLQLHIFVDICTEISKIVRIAGAPSLVYTPASAHNHNGV